MKKVILSRDIKLKKIELIAEVDFTDSENPYNELLKGVNSIYDLKRVMKNANLEDPQINMIISKLEKIRVINDGKIYKNIVSTKEYGKYEFIYVENDKLIGSFPIAINRIKPGKSNDITNISNNSIIRDINNSNKFYESYINKEQNFKIVRLEKNKEQKYLGINKRETTKITLKWSLDLENNSNNWFLEGNIKVEGKNKRESHDNKNLIRIENKKNLDINNTRINSLLDNNWDAKNQSMNITFDEIKNNNKAKNSFYLNFDKDITFDEFGDFRGEFKNIPIIPINENNAMEWFIYLFKSHVNNLSKYISFDELEQIWNNQFEKTPISKKFDLIFNFENIVGEFEKGSSVYWQLMAGKDLNPFKTLVREKQLRNIIIKKKNNIDIEEDIIINIMGYNKIDKLTIIDRYVTDKRHYNSLEQVISSLRRLNDDVNISVYTKKKDNNIIKKVKDLNINYNALNQYLPHARLWIFESNNENRYFIVDNSIDFIKYSKHSNNFDIKEQVIFAEFNRNDIDKKFFEILGEDNE